MVLRLMSTGDAERVAGLHSTSWQSAYRGILTDAYLDHDVEAERRDAWRLTLASLTDEEFGLLAVHDDRIVGFAFVRVHADPIWGTLIDNLHVHPDVKGQGIGRLLMDAIGRELAQRAPTSGVHLWVFEANTPSRAFYTAMGGEHVQYVVKAAPDGQDVPEWRVAWPGPDALRRGG